MTVKVEFLFNLNIFFMKKSIIAFAALALLACPTINAQEEIKGDYSADVEFNLFGNAWNTFRINELNLRYHLDKSSAVRIILGYGMNNDKTVVPNDNQDPAIDRDKTYTISHSTTETVNKSQNFKIGAGYELHKMVFGKVDVYGGLVAQYQMNMYSGVQTYEENTENQNVGAANYTKRVYTDNWTREYFKSNSAGQNNNFAISARLLGGANVYFYKNVYLGTELGFQYTYAKQSQGYNEYNRKQVTKNYSGASKGASTLQNTVTTTNVSSSETGVSKTTTVTNTNGTITSNETPGYTPTGGNDRTANAFGLFIQPAFRIGIRF